ncbi:MAG TPA: TRAP transporter small permease [Alphaproteobacteria bacterium]
MLSSFNEWTARGLLVVAGLHAFLLGFLVTADVTGRVLFNSPVQGTPEIVSMSIVIICFLLSAYSVRSGGMLHVDFLVSNLGRRPQLVLSTIGMILGAGFFALIVWGSYEPTLHAWISNEFEGEGALHVPVWPARVSVIVGSVLVILNYLGLAAANLRELFGAGGEGSR